MAIEEISFTNTNGEEINLSNLVNQMINYYQLKLEVGETAVTDFNEGSEIRNLLEAFAIGIYALLEEQHEATEIAFISTSHDAWLDRIGELPFIDLPRVSADYSEGEVTFTLATAQTSQYVIPADTVLACSGTGLEFITSTECVIAIGETTGTAAAECLTSGSDGNVVAEAIDTVSSEFVDTELVSVSNASAFEGGSDDEDDEEYRERLLANVRADGFGTMGYYKALCENVSGVHDVLLIDDASYTKKVLVNGDVKPTPDTLLVEVLTELTDISNIVLNHSFNIGKPTYTSIDLSVELTVTTELDEDILEAVVQLLFDGGSGYEFEYTGLMINEPMTKARIEETLLIFADVVSVDSVKYDVSGTATDFDVLSPEVNGVLKLDSVTFTQTEV